MSANSGGKHNGLLEGGFARDGLSYSADANSLNEKLEKYQEESKSGCKGQN